MVIKKLHGSMCLESSTYVVVLISNNSIFYLYFISLDIRSHLYHWFVPIAMVHKFKHMGPLVYGSMS
jgi:hypothetical protein